MTELAPSVAAGNVLSKKKVYSQISWTCWSYRGSDEGLCDGYHRWADQLWSRGAGWREPEEGGGLNIQGTTLGRAGKSWTRSGTGSRTGTGKNVWLFFFFLSDKTCIILSLHNVTSTTFVLKIRPTERTLFYISRVTQEESD